MGATNPAHAAEGTIRKRHATSIERNCIHGSDAPETAAVELGFFFSGSELRKSSEAAALLAGGVVERAGPRVFEEGVMNPSGQTAAPGAAGVPLRSRFGGPDSPATE